MLALSRRSSLVLALGLVLTASSLTASDRSIESTSPCEQLRAWAQQHYQDREPTLEEIARFDRSHRLAIFTVVTPQVRAALWQEQFRRFESQPDLTATQRALVGEAKTLATPAFYSRDKAAAAAMNAFWKRAQSAFTSPEHRDAWFKIGSVVPSAVTAGGNTSGENWCGCSSAWGWLECESGLCPGAYCDRWLGCGMSGGSMCDGFCQP